MTAPTPVIETFCLGPFVSSRIWTGLWQLSSPEWGTAKASKIRQAMNRYVEMGYTGFGTSISHVPLLSPLMIPDMVCYWLSS